MPTIPKLNRPKDFANVFLMEYLANGFGTRSKSEIDTLVMDLLLKYGDVANKSNQELSIILRMPAARVKKLRYEARLKYQPADDYVKDSFLLVLLRAQFIAEKNLITFVMEDDYVRHAITGMLKQRGHFADSSFNTEIIKIDRVALGYVIRELYDETTQVGFEQTFDFLMREPELTDSERSARFQKGIIDFAKQVAVTFSLELVKQAIGTNLR